MMDLLRRNASSWMTIGVFTVLIFVFAINFGPWMGGGGGNSPYVAVVNSQAISTSHLQIAYRNHVQEMRRYNPDFAKDETRVVSAKKQVLDNLVNQELLAQWARKQGLVVSDARLAQTIREQFTSHDQPFDRELYQRIVAGVYQTTPKQFEDLFRRELLAQAAHQLLSYHVQASEAEVKQAFQTRHNKVSVEAIQIDEAFFKPNKPPSEKELNVFIKTNNQEIKEEYSSHLSRYRTPKKVRARHILIKIDDKASSEKKKQAREKIDQAYKRVAENKEDFATVAKEISEDSSSHKGGDLGFFTRKDMVKPFANAAFMLKQNEISEVVQTRFGYHIIQVQEIQKAQEQALQEVRNDIGTQLWQKQQATQAAESHGHTLLQRLKQGMSPARLKAKGLLVPKGGNRKATNAPRLVKSEFFTQNTRYIPGIGSAPEVARVAFELNAEKPVYDGLVKSGKVLYLVRLKDRQRAKDKDFSKEKDTLQASITWMHRSEWMDVFLKTLRDEATISHKNAF